MGEAEASVDVNYVTNRLLSSTMGGAMLTPGNPEVFEIWFSNGYTLKIIDDPSTGMRVNLVPPPAKPAKKK
jgi:hypothetical protein